MLMCETNWFESLLTHDTQQPVVLRAAAVSRTLKSCHCFFQQRFVGQLGPVAGIGHHQTCEHAVLLLV